MAKPTLGDVRRGQHQPPKPGVPKFREAAIETAEHRMRLLADALGRILVAAKVTSEQSLTGPQLLLLADNYAEHLEAASTAPAWMHVTRRTF